MSTRTLRNVAVVVAVLTSAGVARAERLESEDSATHVVVGTVERVSSRWGLDFDVLGSYVFRYFDAEFAVERVERGTGVQPGDLLHVRYWRKTWAPISPLVLLLLALLGLKVLGRIRPTWLRWLLRSVLVAVALFLALLTLPMPGTYGHTEFPQEGRRIRAYLRHDPVGGYDALYPAWAKTP